MRLKSSRVGEWKVEPQNDQNYFDVQTSAHYLNFDFTLGSLRRT